ncbi:lysophospholipase [Desulfocicer vacuolatum DSM 3385]|uniref:Lysophospholipase n=1 Tax=Desulfocicer vacuolatum DSM 3385 TaxID=1121400 RepID=A0A1W2BES2_9BACT|nr:alpha/beta hydrolase [Desulfocicer vacuolatum]SMC71419.1 lysophospholipase [Desulfocicer vacuolatum DSM 3385]
MEFNYFRAGDGQLMRYGVAKIAHGNPKGCILLLNGRSEFMEKYQAVVEKLVERNFHVISLDWRGQGLSVRELENRDKGHIKSFQCYLDDLFFFYTTVVAPLGLPVTVLAHSMGGHIALRFLACRGTQIKKAVLVSPMVDIVTAPIPRPLAGILARQMVRWGMETCYVPGNTDYNRDAVKFSGNPLTHDPRGFWQEHLCIEKNRDLVLGGVTWGWLKAAFDSIDTLKVKGVAQQISAPVLLLSAAQDRVVSCRAQEKLCRNLSNGIFLSVPGARHEILNESESILSFFWQAFDAFTDLMEDARFFMKK